MKSDQYFDVAIIGAGPAGATCALALRESGLKVLVIDKETFPRDKICGDAINGYVPKLLERLSPNYKQALEVLQPKSNIKSCKLISPDFHELDLDFTHHGYCATRLDFDNFLFELAHENKDATFLQNCKLKTIQRKEGKCLLETDAGNFEAKIVVGADGAHSVVGKQLANFKVDYKHYSGAVRAYYKDLEYCRPETLEVFFPKGFLPGYFWIFPTSDNHYNVGFGMLSKTISEKKINVTKAFKEIIQQNPTISKRFKNGIQTDKIRGFGLPLGSKKQLLAGENFLLTGDAASLVDPFTGEGIGNAMFSAEIAAKHILECFEKQDFSESKMKEYETKIYHKFWADMKTSYWAQRLVSDRVMLLNWSIRLAGKSRFIKSWLNRVI